MCSNIMCESVNLIVASCRLTCPTVQRRRRTSNQGTPGPDTTLEPFGLYSAARDVTVIPENWLRDATNTLTLSSLGRY
jgi:hypothetical protein